jgi:hypothetical protein
MRAVEKTCTIEKLPCDPKNLKGGAYPRPPIHQGYKQIDSLDEN